jgi:hypothetical protein
MVTKSNLTRSVERGDRYERQCAAKRVRLLYRNLIAQHGAGQNRALIEAACLRVAELTAAGEDLRAKLLATTEPSDALINSITRLESTQRRAALDLTKLGTIEQAWSSDLLPKVIDDDEDDEADESQSAQS